MYNRGRFFNRRGGSFHNDGGNYVGGHSNFRGGWGGPNRGNFRGRSNFNPNRGRGFQVPITRDPRVNRNEREENGPGKRLSENEIGVTQYVSKCEGFKGIIKSRYSDFQVSEINLNGDIAKLTDVNAPDISQYLDIQKNNEEEDEELLILNKYNVELLPIEIWDKINALAVADEEVTDKIEVDVTDKSKEERTKIHDSVKKVFGMKIVGSTVAAGDKKMIVFTKYFKGVRIDKREKWKWPGEYVHFIVYKENCDTMEAASYIASGLNMNHIKPAFFGYAGTKDRRAKTSQWFCIKRIDPHRIMNSCKQLRNITVGNYEFKDSNLKLGSLKGNRFRIALRNVIGTDELINESVESLKENGFINYYGLQRFGSRADTPTYKIGMAILQGNYQEAIDLILEPRGPFARQLRKYRETRDVQRSLFGIPRNRQSTEIKLLQGLAHCNKNDLVSALDRIPRNTRLLYIHSYQSWIWNRCVSERLLRFGFSCQVGDLVLLNPSDIPEEVTDDVPDWEEEDSFHENDSKEDAEQSDEKTIEESKNSETEPKDKNKKGFHDDKPKLRVKILTEKDIEDKTYTIFDIVLPLPGYDIKYPPNIKDHYEMLLKEDNLTLELKQRVKCYSLCGTYRRICSKPGNMSWKTVRYSDPYGDLIASDLDELNKKEPLKHLEDGTYKALILDFTLASSTYATMALREILKSDTSCESQAQNNDYHKDKSDVDDKTNTDPAVEPSESKVSIKDEVSMESKMPEGSVVDKRKLSTEEDDNDIKKKIKIEV